MIGQRGGCEGEILDLLNASLFSIEGKVYNEEPVAITETQALLLNFNCPTCFDDVHSQFKNGEYKMRRVTLLFSLFLFFLVFGSMKARMRGDFNDDGSVNIMDLIAFLGHLSGRAPIEDMEEHYTILTPQNIHIDSLETAIFQNIVMVSIPGGTFQMGQTGIAEPVHTVTLDSFWISQTEITGDQYSGVTGLRGAGESTPATLEVNWYAAAGFCNSLSVISGLDTCYNTVTWECDYTKNGFRLPTEAEWEYACRAGTITKYYTGDTESDLDRAGWYGLSPSEGGKIQPVGLKVQNVFGLYDMHGNAEEWCNDWFGSYYPYELNNPTGPVSGRDKVSRGGSWSSNAEYCTSAYRRQTWPTLDQDKIGFRIVGHGKP